MLLFLLLLCCFHHCVNVAKISQAAPFQDPLICSSPTIHQFVFTYEPRTHTHTNTFYACLPTLHVFVWVWESECGRNKSNDKSNSVPSVALCAHVHTLHYITLLKLAATTSPPCPIQLRVTPTSNGFLKLGHEHLQYQPGINNMEGNSVWITVGVILMENHPAGMKPQMTTHLALTHNGRNRGVLA